MLSNRHRVLILAVFVLLVTAGARDGLLQQARQPANAAADSRDNRMINAVAEYRIGPEDVLDISVWRNEELSRTVVVRPDGMISLPLLNDIPAANLTPMELRDVLAKGYSRFVNEAEVSLIVREIHSLKVSVHGQVRLPGRFELRSQATVLDALAMAGGLTEYAKRDQIAVHRRVGMRVQILGFDYNSVLNGNVEQNFVLHPGDIILVP